MDTEKEQTVTDSTEKVQDLSFDDIKRVAADNISALLKDLKDFETAIKQENIQDIYRIYNGRLNKELRQNSNQNHEIDELLASKIHESLINVFPFMHQTKKEDATIFYYQIDQYYRQRPTVYLDSSIPELYILPNVLEEWRNPQTTSKEEIAALEVKMDEIEAKKINAKIAIDQLDAKLHELKTEQNNIEQNKGFFNRGKVDEDLEAIHIKQKQLQEQRLKWLPYLTTDNSQVHLEKEALLREYEDKRLQRAIITKELRLINKHFGSVEQMVEKLEAFLVGYLAGEGVESNGR